MSCVNMQVSMGGSQYPLNSPAFQQQLQAAQASFLHRLLRTWKGCLGILFAEAYGG